MAKDFLDKILNCKRLEIAAGKESCDMQELEAKAAVNVGRGFKKALSNSSKINIISEYKKASPSKGDICLTRDPAEQALAYQAGGAAAVSVLTEVDYFKGCLSDMTAAREAVSIPVLRKDFTIDPFQIIESAAAGCDAVLLITRILSDGQLSEYIDLARQYKIDPLVEIFDEADLERAVKAGGDIIGINNRDLVTFAVDNDNAVRLSRQLPQDCIAIAASGVSSVEDIKCACEKGLNNFLVGETLMRTEDPTGYLKEMLSVK